MTSPRSPSSVNLYIDSLHSPDDDAPWIFSRIESCLSAGVPPECTRYAARQRDNRDKIVG